MGVGLYFWFRGSEVPQNPRHLFRLSRRAFANQQWDKLYAYTSPQWRDKFIPKMRKYLKFILRQPGAASVEPEKVSEFSRRQVFRVWLETYSRTPPGKKLLARVEEFKIIEINDFSDTKIIKFNRPVSVPGSFRGIVVGETDGQWRIIGLPE
ncbi:MAG: hypothetical protein ACQEP7_05840 [bacterium]